MSCGLRDVIEFEALGRPGVLIASDAFAQAAANQVELLGQPKLAYAGGDAGLFSMVYGTWVAGEIGSTPVTRSVEPWR